MRAFSRQRLLKCINCGTIDPVGGQNRHFAGFDIAWQQVGLA